MKRLVLVGILSCVAGEGLACGRSATKGAAVALPAARAPATVTLSVPRARDPIVIDAELEGKKVWEADTGNTKNLRDSGGRGMVPYTEAKARWGDGKLYLMLYAGDLDLQGQVRDGDGPVENDDAFHLELGAGAEVRTVSVSVLGTVADALCTRAATGRACDPRWQSHAVVAVDRDGTLNKVGDNDEEWVVEMALPFAALGITNAGPGTRLAFSVRRCEVGQAGRHACGSWGVEPPGELLLAD